MNTKQKAAFYADFFKSIDVNDGTTRIALKDNTPQELHDAIKAAHGDKLPDDWTHSTFADLLNRITGYDVETIDDLQDVLHEIVDGCVDIYTHDLLKWLASDIDNLEYLAEAAHGWSTDDGAWQLLARAQYSATNEIMQHVVSLLYNNA